MFYFQHHWTFKRYQLIIAMLSWFLMIVSILLELMAPFYRCFQNINPFLSKYKHFRFKIYALPFRKALTTPQASDIDNKSIGDDALDVTTTWKISRKSRTCDKSDSALLFNSFPTFQPCPR